MLLGFLQDEDRQMRMLRLLHGGSGQKTHCSQANATQCIYIIYIYRLSIAKRSSSQSATTSEQNSETHRLLIRNSRKQHKATCWAGEILHQPHRTRHWHKAPADFAGAFSLAQTSWVGAEVKVSKRPHQHHQSALEILWEFMGHGRMTIYQNLSYCSPWLITNMRVPY